MSFDSPVYKDKVVHLINDPPHIMKCFRNIFGYSLSDLNSSTRQLYLPNPNKNNTLTLIHYDCFFAAFREYNLACGHFDAQRGISDKMYKAIESSYSKMNTALAANFFSSRHQQLLTRIKSWILGGRNSAISPVSLEDLNLIDMIDAFIPYAQLLNVWFDVCNSRDTIFASKLGGAHNKRRCVKKVNKHSNYEINTLLALPSMLTYSFLPLVTLG